MTDEQLTDHFSLAELCYSSTAIRKGIDNTPDAETTENLRVLAGYLERVRLLFGGPIHIDSAYRSPKVNKAVGGSETSSHVLGQAADIVVPGYTPFEVCTMISESDIPFDQVIYEGNWCHLGIGDRMRKQVLTAHFEDGHVRYTEGLSA